ncbi:hypothetical protein STA3757_30640 [Stanieria sp. NIES-3757]|nr:hypothetical protein STA3757_30640 [Stanieria sp. NIES-3757]
MPKIIGLDVGQGYAVACLLDHFPVNIQQHFKQLQKNRQFIKLKCDRASVEKLLSLQPDVIVLEPSGFWYSAFWARVAEVHHVEVFWIGHADLSHTRGSYGFTNKRDDEDALCLAATYFDDRFIDVHGRKRYLQHYQSSEIDNARSLFLGKEQLAKLRSGMIAQIKQRLSYEFPEMASKTFTISRVQGFTPFLGWLGEGSSLELGSRACEPRDISSNSRYDKLYESSIALSLDISISDYTREHALTITQLEKRITIALLELEHILNFPEFVKYCEVFNRFGFGLSTSVLLLLHVYPFEKFLVSGLPWVDYELSKSDKLVKRHRSLRNFQAFLGLSYSIAQSGDRTTRAFHGSTMMRSHLYAWALCQICPKNYKVNTEIGRALSNHYQQLRKSNKGKDSIIRILFKATRMLFYELNKVIT